MPCVWMITYRAWIVNIFYFSPTGFKYTVVNLATYLGTASASIFQCDNSLNICCGLAFFSLHLLLLFICLFDLLAFLFFCLCNMQALKLYNAITFYLFAFESKSRIFLLIVLLQLQLWPVYLEGSIDNGTVVNLNNFVFMHNVD